MLHNIVNLNTNISYQVKKKKKKKKMYDHANARLHRLMG
jgi:hypothetical protein